jgi:hypothetical protein
MEERLTQQDLKQKNASKQRFLKVANIVLLVRLLSFVGTLLSIPRLYAASSSLQPALHEITFNRNIYKC